jgi:hypothetical protein
MGLRLAGVNAEGHIYAIDTGNNRIQKFTPQALRKAAAASLSSSRSAYRTISQ